MRKFLLYSSALMVSGLLSGAAEAACIQTPSCSSLGYSSSSSCSGGIKCPFGNYWNCTGPNNTTEINKLKTEISGIKTDISNIKTNITNLTNRITNIENNSGSGSDSGLLCAECEVGDYVCGGKCYSYQVAMPDGEYSLNPECTDLVIEKKVEVGKNTCRKIPTRYSKNPVITLTYDEAMKYADINETSYRTTITLTQVRDDTALVCNYISSNRFGYNSNVPDEQMIWYSFGINIVGFNIFRNTEEMACNQESMYSSDPYKDLEQYAKNGKLKMLNITTFN